MSIQTITPQALWQRLQDCRDLDLIDVRTPAEYESVHAEGARLVPLDRLDAAVVAASRRRRPADEPLYVICKGGTRSAQACQKLKAAGLANVVSVEGGTAAWEQAGLPVVRGRWVLPLDRQIQLTAGFMALTGVVLGTFLNPWFYIVPGFVGFGLAMAGLTGFCPMAILLARMPWNKRGAHSGGSCCRPAPETATNTVTASAGQ